MLKHRGTVIRTVKDLNSLFVAGGEPEHAVPLDLSSSEFVIDEAMLDKFHQQLPKFSALLFKVALGSSPSAADEHVWLGMLRAGLAKKLLRLFIDCAPSPADNSDLELAKINKNPDLSFEDAPEAFCYLLKVKNFLICRDDEVASPHSSGAAQCILL